MRRTVPLGIVALSIGLVAAQELDSQFILLRPGLTKSVFRLEPQAADPLSLCSGLGTSFFLCEGVNESDVARSRSGSGTDATGAFYHLRIREDPSRPDPCGLDPRAIDFEIERLTPAGSELIVRLPKCASSATAIQSTFVTNLASDDVNGSLYVATRTYVTPTPSGTTTFSWGIVKIAGLPTLLEIIATYQPGTGSLTWNTPKHPEGLQAADRFQVFTGDVAELPDFSRAVASDCAVPDTGSPAAGDIFSILDPLPVPTAGRARYVLVGVEHVGQRRFGRQNIGGVLSGRDPTLFPSCN